jgi:hypothetical protein
MISTFCNGDAKELLIDLEKDLIRLRNRYDLFKDGKWKPLAQLRGQALRGHIEYYWSKIVEGAMITQTGTVASHLLKFKKLIHKVNVKYLGRDTADIQRDAMFMGKLRHEGQDHEKAVKRLFEINNDIETAMLNRDLFASKVVPGMSTFDLKSASKPKLVSPSWTRFIIPTNRD